MSATIDWAILFGEVVKVNEVEVRQMPEWVRRRSGFSTSSGRGVVPKPAASGAQRAPPRAAIRLAGSQGVLDGGMPARFATLDAEALRATSASTLSHYNEGAQPFWMGTRNHDVSQNLETLLRHLPGAGPHTILDLGCGPGRDLIWLRDRGHVAVGLDGAEQFVRMARAHSGCEVLHQDFLSLDLGECRFDGIFANASLFHVPSQELPRVLAELLTALKAGGILFSSNPHGPDREGFSGERYCCFLQLDTYRQYLTAAGFVELEHYYRPAGKPRAQQPWLASVWQKGAQIGRFSRGIHSPT